MDTQSSGARVAAAASRRSSRSWNAPKVYEGITKWCIYLVFLLIPLFFLPWNLDVLEVNKQTLLVILTFVASLSWLGGMITNKRFSFRRGWLNLLPFVFLVSVLVSTVLSLGGFISWVGEATQEYMSFLSTASFVVLFYIIVNTCAESKMLRNVLFAFLIGASLTILVGLGSVLGIQLVPFDFADSKSFNTIGTMNAFSIFLIFTTIFANAIWLVARKSSDGIIHAGWKGILSKVLIFFVSLAAVIVLAAIDYWVLWVVLLFGMLVLFAFPLLRSQEFPQTSRFIIPMILVVVSLLLLFLNTPLRLDIPAEVTPSYKASWDVATQTLGETSALFGSGPGTYIYDYTQYHSQDVNNSIFWNTRFDRSNSHFLTMLTTLGVIGTLVWVIFVVMLAIKVLSRLVREREHTEWKLGFILFAPWATLVVASFLYSSDFTLVFLFFAFAALLSTQAMRKVKEATVSESPRLGLVFSFLFVLVAVAVVTVLFVTGQRYAGEVAFAQAVNMDREGAEVSDIVVKLDKAATYNRYNDIYYRNLGQALLLRVSEELAAEEEMSAERANLIRALTAASINAAKMGTDLGSHNVLNWRIRGSIYREVIGLIGGADAFAVASFERAIELDPVNPLNYTELAKVHLVIAEIARQLLASPDEETAAAAQIKLDESLTLAAEALDKAIELKPDYAPALYQLAIVFERQGRLDDAVLKMESVAQYNPLDVGVAFQLGLLYIRQGDYDAAEAQLERTVTLLPTYSNARWYLAAVYEVNGDLEAATEQVQEVYNLNPDNELVKERLERLLGGEVSDEIPEPVEEGEQGATDVSEGEVIEEIEE